jgi:thiol-disulfide isomerase/thioredoxin
LRTVLLLIFTCSLIAGHAQAVDTTELKQRMRERLLELMKEGISDLQDKKLPTFQITTVEGRAFNSESLNGKPTLVNIWFTHCAPCIEEIPMLNRLKKSYFEEVNFIAITYQDSVEISEFLEWKPFNFTQLIDARDYWDELGVKTAPHTLVTDENGIVRYMDKGKPGDLMEFETELRKQIEEVLKQ